MIFDEQHVIEITDVAFGGDGVGRHNGLVVFVPFTAPGDVVKVRILKRTSRFLRGEIVEILSPSESRVAPLCRYFMKCGGCRYQHIEYSAQLAIKRKQLSDLFRRIGRIAQLPICMITPSPEAFGYRNRIVLHGPGTPGFLGFDHITKLPVESCLIACKGINRKMASLANLDLKKGEDLCLVAGDNDDVRHFVENAALINAGPPELIVKTINGIRYESPCGSFFQVNDKVASLVVECAHGLFIESRSEVFIDAYCGAGLFTLAMAELAGKCYGIDADPNAVSAAKRNATGLKANNCAFIAGSSESRLPDIFKKCDPLKTCVLLDPPRAGCSKTVLDAVCAFKPGRVIYLSCEPSILSRDASTLVKPGFMLSSISLFDMFPQTAHIEAMAVFDSEGADMLRIRS